MHRALLLVLASLTVLSVLVLFQEDAETTTTTTRANDETTYVSSPLTYPKNKKAKANATPKKIAKVGKVETKLEKTTVKTNNQKEKEASTEMKAKAEKTTTNKGGKAGTEKKTKSPGQTQTLSPTTAAPKIPSSPTATMLFRPELGPAPRKSSVPTANRQGGLLCPHYLILGVRKGGTTSLHRYLCASHPTIFSHKISELPNLDTNGNGTKTREYTMLELKQDAQVGEVFADLGTMSYSKAFSGVPKDNIVGDSNVGRLVNDAEAIGQFCTNRNNNGTDTTRFFALLRDPVERCVSNIKMRLRLHTFSGNVTEFILKHVEEMEQFVSKNPDWPYAKNPKQGLDSAKNCINEGNYVVHLRRLLAHGVDPQSLRLYFTEDMKKHTGAVITDALHHLGLSSEHIDEEYLKKSFNAARRRRNRHRRLGGDSYHISPELEQRIRKLLAPFEQELCQLLGIEELPWPTYVE